MTLADDTTTDRDGVITSYEYDSLHQLLETTRLGVTTRNSYDPAGRIWQVERLGTDGTNRPSMAPSLTSYDRAGRTVFQTNALGQRTGYTCATDLQTGITLNTIRLWDSTRGDC